MKGILDRFEDNDKAVILLEEIKHELIVPINKLPEGSTVGTYFHIVKKNGAFEICSIDYSKTKLEANKTSDLMNKLRLKSKGTKFKKK